MKFISNESSVWASIETIKEEYMAARVRGDSAIELSDIEYSIENLVRQMEGNAALLHMRNEITRRKTNKQEILIKTMQHKINRLETEVSVLKGEPQPMEPYEGGNG